MEKITARQYETAELSFRGPEPQGSHVTVDLTAEFTREGESRTVKGFYAGNGVYKVRFLPEAAGTYTWRLLGTALPGAEGTLEAAPAGEGSHGPVRAEGTHLRYADGKWFHSFGTTVYALAHQSEALTAETLESLRTGPFNKVRMCLFPKHYNYNFNNPEFYPFRVKAGLEKQEFDGRKAPLFPGKKTEKDGYWDVNHPDFAFWDRFEGILKQIFDLGIQVDLILFHPYDRWGFSNLRQEDNLTYLDYLLRRFAAYPGIWWSLANEYDLCMEKTLADWEEIEGFVADNDPFHHLLGNHNCFQIWDAGRKNVTHASWQSKQLSRVGELQRRWGKPVLIDECRYEGNIPEFWGNISGEEMTRRFWQVTAQGGYCTHGETYFPGTPEAEKSTRTGEKEVVWWARGGVLHGQSPARIAFLRELMESLPGPLEAQGSGFMGDMMGKTEEEILAQTPEPMRGFAQVILRMDQRERDLFYSVEASFSGHCGEEAYLTYLDDQCAARYNLRLPETGSYRVEVIDTWNMTRETVLTDVSGEVAVPLPGKPAMAVLAVRD